MVVVRKRSLKTFKKDTKRATIELCASQYHQAAGGDPEGLAAEDPGVHLLAEPGGLHAWEDAGGH